jgi:hypothetical protein
LPSGDDVITPLRVQESQVAMDGARQARRLWIVM